MSQELAILGGTPAFSTKIYITRPIVPPLEAFMSEVARIFDTAVFTNAGPYANELEVRLATFLSARDCAVVANGTLGLLLALKAGSGMGRVATTPFTFPATVHALTWLGLEPVFCDIDENTWTMDPKSAEQALAQGARVLLPVHTFGIPCDLDGFDRLAEACGAQVIYDAAHAFGTRVRGRVLAEAGAATVYSFHATKTFSTFEGGAIASRHADLMHRVRLLRNFGYDSETVIACAGINAKLTEIQSAFGLVTLPLFETERARRQRNYELYGRLLAGTPGVTFQNIPSNVQWNYQYCPVLVDPDAFGLTRDQLQEALLAENIVARRYFFPLCSNLPMYRDLPSAAPDRLPVASRVSRDILCLPLYGALSPDAVETIVGRVARAHDVADRVRHAVVQS